jgi:hypothetical protein
MNCITGLTLQRNRMIKPIVPEWLYKAQHDVMLYGTSVVLYKLNGEPEHIPVERWHEFEGSLFNKEEKDE